MTVEEANARGVGRLPGFLGLEFTEVGGGRMVARLRIRPELLNTDGDLHGGTVTALADAVCGIGSVAHLREGAERVATIELKVNLLRTVRDGVLVCEGTLVHGGQTTQVWDARVWRVGEEERPVALFRCTQLLLPGERG
jgi:uncharacterized protein (TIGR00369 family)